jgi:transcriptional regulator with XRE-family HTH domain
MAKTMKIRAVLAANLKVLMAANNHSQGDVHRHTGIAQSSIGRIINMQVDATIGTLESIADLYHLQAWQLLVQDFDHTNPPMLKQISDKEKEFYDKIKLAAKEIAKFQ